MKVIITPSKAMGSVNAPPSKSLAHRLLICAGMCEGESIVHGISEVRTFPQLSIVSRQWVQNIRE